MTAGLSLLAGAVHAQQAPPTVTEFAQQATREGISANQASQHFSRAIDALVQTCTQRDAQAADTEKRLQWVLENWVPKQP